MDYTNSKEYKKRKTKREETPVSPIVVSIDNVEKTPETASLPASMIKPKERLSRSPKRDKKSKELSPSRVAQEVQGKLDLHTEQENELEKQLTS